VGKYKTVVVDSGGEWARLTFSFDMKKHAKDLEDVRSVSNYPGATERINMAVRRFKDYRDKQGVNMVILCHEQIEKIYAKGGMINTKGTVPQEPIGVRGWPNLPGSTCPTEVMNACDCVFRMKEVNGKPVWMAKREPLGGGGDYWVVKDRFNAMAVHTGGLLPASYEELAKLAKGNPACNWEDAQVFLIYGVPGIGKTRSLLTFPRPLHILDIDHGSQVLKSKGALPEGITVEQFNSEECDDYMKFVGALERAGAA
jgi:hypothetical protein